MRVFSQKQSIMWWEFAPKNHQFSQKCLLSWFVFTLSFYLLSRSPDYKRLFTSTSFPQKHPPKKYYVRGQSHSASFEANLLSSLIFLCVQSSPLFVFVLLLKSFLKSQYTSYYFYEQNVARSDAQDILTTLYLVGQASESRIISRFSLSHLLGQARFYKVFRSTY